MRTILIYDTTLRDGSQGEGITLSLNDKLRIASKLDELGVAYIEGGWPGSNPKDEMFFERMHSCPPGHAGIVAFGSTRRPKVEASQDISLRGIERSKARIACLFGKTWLFHVREVLRTTPEENLSMIAESVGFLKKKGIRVFYDAEHFFDAYREDRAYAIDCLVSAQESGAEYIVLCDTNGGSLPSEISRAVTAVQSALSVPLGIHCHNDSGLAVANSLAAVEAGCDMVQGTINGYGERCGNADLIQIIANLELKMGLKCLPPGHLEKLTETSYFVSEISNMRHNSNQPFTGDSAFAHKAGVHINAVLKNPASYEHIDPSAVGNNRKTIVSELGGKSSIMTLAKGMNIDLDRNDPKLVKIHGLLQEMEMKGYHFEAAEASFELLLKKNLKKVKEFFKLDNFRVVINKEKTKSITTEAIIKIKVKDKTEHTAAEGDGPVNALDNALRKALKQFYPALSHMHLSDFKVRVLDEKAGSSARVRVLIQSQDETDSWNTIGVSENIIEASWQALVDSVEYKLMKDTFRKSQTKLCQAKP